jgi:hypothetical protein
MATLDTLRNDIIEKLLAISDKDYMSALNKLVGNSSKDNEIVGLTDEQKLILRLSDKDIAAGRLISQDELDKNDLEWLKGNSLDRNRCQTKA